MTNLFKVKISLHPLFIVILLCSIFTGYFIEIMLLFLFVMIHEIGHLFMASYFKWNIKEIKLLPFGGVLIVDDAQASNAKEESLVALAGPLQNIIIIVFTWIFGQFNWLSYDWAEYIINANIWLALFNLLPINPLDGGKLLQAVISLTSSYFYTLKIMTWISIIGASVMMIYAVGYGVWKVNAGPQLNLLLVGTFLLADNIMLLKHLPFLLYRFILQRAKTLDVLENALSENTIPIVIHERDTLLSVFKKLKRQSRHLFYYVSSKTKRVEVKAEHELLEKFSRGKHLNRALIDIFD